MFNTSALSDAQLKNRILYASSNTMRTKAERELRLRKGILPKV